MSALVGALGHEAKHLGDAGHYASPQYNGPIFRDSTMRPVRRSLEANVAVLQHANYNRWLERRADQQAGEVLGQAHRRGKRARQRLVPSVLLQFLQPPEGINRRTWTPYSFYDRVAQRKLATGRAFGAQLHRQR